jgi:multiple sugar transport system substrate-binding protein
MVYCSLRGNVITGMKTLTASALALVLLVSGCGAGRERTEPETGSTKAIGHHLTYDPNVPVADGKKITVTFWSQLDQENIYRSMIEDYTALHPNVRIELSSSHFKDHFNKLIVALQSGIGPDMFHMHNSFDELLLPYMAPYPEEIFPREALLADFRQVESHIEDGRIRYIDTGHMTSSIYYNTVYWKEAGLTERDIPRTWDELRQVAKLLTAYDDEGQIVRAGFNPNGIGFSLFTAMNLQQGVPPFEGARPPVPVLETEASERSLRYLSGLYHEDRVADIRLPEFHESFGMGTSAMIYAWGWTRNWLEKYFPELEYDVFHIPTWTMEMPRYFDRSNGESSMGVNERAADEHKAVAFDIIKFFLVKDEYLVEMSRQFGVAPSKLRLAESPSLRNDRLLATFYSVLDRTLHVGTLPDFYETTLASTLIDPVVIDRVPIKPALADTAARLAGLFAQQHQAADARR